MENERYKVINKIDYYLFNKEIPLIVTELNTSEDVYIGKEVLNVTVRNIGARIVKSIKFTFAFFDNLGNLKDKVEYNIENLELRTNMENSFTCNVDSVKIDKKDFPKVIINEMKFEKAEIDNNSYCLDIIKEIDLVQQLGNLKEQYKREVNDINTEVNVKAKYNNFEDYWNCVCGNYYFNDIDSCPKCKISKQKLEEITNEEYLKKKLDEYEKRQAEIREKTINEAKKVGNKTAKIAIIIAIAIVIGVIAFFVGKDIMVKNMLKESNVSGAVRLNNNVLSSYKDYLNKLIDDYDTANKIDEELKLLENISEYSTDSTYSKKFIEVQYKYVLKEYESKNYENAYKYLDNVLKSDKYKKDEDLSKKAVEIKYNKALKYIDKEKYEEAKQLLENMEYEDSKSRLDICNYHLASIKLKNKNYKEAKEQFESMNAPYENSEELLKDAKYNYAIQRYEKYKKDNSYEISTLESIKDEFVGISGYKDAKKYLDDLTEALKWHGVWHNTAFGEEYYYHYDIKFNYFTSTLTSSGISGKKVDTKYEKSGDKYVWSMSVVGNATMGETLSKQGDILIRDSGSSTKLKYRR